MNVLTHYSLGLLYAKFYNAHVKESYCYISNIAESAYSNIAQPAYSIIAEPAYSNIAEPAYSNIAEPAYMRQFVVFVTSLHFN